MGVDAQRHVDAAMPKPVFKLYSRHPSVVGETGIIVPKIMRCQDRSISVMLDLIFVRTSIC